MREYKNLIDNQDLIGNERVKRIFDEFNRTKEKLETLNIKNTIVMFGSARIKPDDPSECNRAYYDASYKRAKKLAIWSKETCLHKLPEDKFYICTGGGGGIMEAANKGATEAGESTLGFNILLPFEEKPNPYIPEDWVFMFNYFFIRKFYFAFLANAFIVFPGGFGTLDELFEILTLSQTRKMQQIIPFVLFGKDFFGKILNVDVLLDHGFVAEKDKELYIVTDDIEDAFNHITVNINCERHAVDKRCAKPV